MSVRPVPVFEWIDTDKTPGKKGPELGGKALGTE